MSPTPPLDGLGMQIRLLSLRTKGRYTVMRLLKPFREQIYLVFPVQKILGTKKASNKRLGEMVSGLIAPA